jgi:ribosomal protein S18 acetylase RimI-like enzyme
MSTAGAIPDITTMDVTMDEVSTETLPTLRRLHRENFGDECSAEWYASISEKQSVAFLANFDGSSIGEICAEQTMNGKALYVASLSVIEAYRRCGIARLLLDGLMKLFPNAESCYLHVRMDNEPAKRFYYQYGFTFIDIAPWYYDDEHGLVLSIDNPSKSRLDCRPPG